MNNITNTSSAHTTHEIVKLATMQNCENTAITVVVGLPRSIRILAASWLAILWMLEQMHYEVQRVKVALKFIFLHSCSEEC